MQTELCFIGWPCGNPSLNIPSQDYRKYFQYEGPNNGAIAYWDDGLPDPDKPPDKDPSDDIVLVNGSFTVTYKFDGETFTSNCYTEISRVYPLSPLILPLDYDGAEMAFFVDGEGSRELVWGPRSNSFPEALPITGISIGNFSMTRADNGQPIEPPPPPGPPEEPPETFIVMKVILKNGDEKEIGREPFEEKPKQAWIACEDCEEHCVRMVQNPDDTYQQSVCVCKEKQNEPDEENMKAAIKAELLGELPPIVVARFKATEEQVFIGKVSSGAHKLIKPELGPLVESILSESEEGMTVLERIVLNALNSDIESLPNLYSSLRSKLISDPDFLTGFKESLNSDKYTFNSLISQLDDKNIADLRTKMKIPLNPDDPKNPNNSDLSANGFTWKVLKSGDAIDKVEKAIGPMDSVSAMLNSGGAIATALQSKYGKPFSIDSSLQSDGKVIFDVSQI